MVAFLTAAALLGQGINILGAQRDMKRVDTQARIQKAAAEANAEGERATIMSKYSDIFSQQASEIASQTAIFANAGVDRAGSLFRQGMRSHEKNFLDTKGKMQDDLRTVNTNLSVQKANIGVTAAGQKKQLQGQIISGLTNMFMMGADYYMGKDSDLLNISGGKTMNGQKLVKTGTTFREVPMLG